MKTFCASIILCFISIPLFCQYWYEYDPAYEVNTPTGVSIIADKFDEANYNDFDVTEIAYWDYVTTSGYNCRILANSTKYYNCHGYAWHNIEGRMAQSDLRWINDVDEEGDPVYNVTKYYTGTNKSYVETQTITDHLRVSYFPSDHSAVTTEDEDSVISKFGWGPLVKHPLEECPWYDNAEIKYYKLWPEINGTFTALCENSERTFTSNISIPGSTYAWTKDNNLLDYVSGAGTTSYRVEATSNSGDAWIQFQMTTPSGEVATRNSWVWVNKPVLNSISGSSYGYTDNTYYYNAVPSYEQRSLSTYTILLEPLNSNYMDAYNTGWAYITFNDPDYYTLVMKADNACGSSGWENKNIVIDEMYDFLISPNPASETANIKMVKISSAKTESELPDFDISIYDINGILYRTEKRSGFDFTIPVDNLKEGSYIVNIRYGKISSNLTLLIKH